MKTLQHDSIEPLYYQLKQIINNEIKEGNLKPGEKIPSENQLKATYGVSRNTIIKAVDELVKSGMLYRKQGKGTFVSKPKLEQPLSGFYSFSKVLKAQGKKPKDIILKIESIVPSAKVTDILGLKENEEVVEIRRLRCDDQDPIILESSFIPKFMITDFEKISKVGIIPLYDLLEQEFNIFVTSAKEYFEPVLIRPEESKLLNVNKGDPALLLERIAYDPERRPVEYCISIVRGDRCRFYTELM